MTASYTVILGTARMAVATARTNAASVVTGQGISSWAQPAAPGRCGHCQASSVRRAGQSTGVVKQAGKPRLRRQPVRLRPAASRSLAERYQPNRPGEHRLPASQVEQPLRPATQVSCSVIARASVA